MSTRHEDYEFALGRAEHWVRSAERKYTPVQENEAAVAIAWATIALALKPDSTPSPGRPGRGPQ